MKEKTCSGNCSCCSSCQEEKQSKKFIIIRLISSMVLYIGALVVYKIFDIEWYYNLIIFGLIYLWISYDILYSALRNIIIGRVFTETFLMSIASIGGFVVKQFPEGVAVMLLYQIGEFLQDYAVDKSRESITSLLHLKVEKATVIRNEKQLEIKVERVRIDEIIVVKSGEKIPLDGVVVNGESSLNMSALTGESLPVDIKAGSVVLSGSINIGGIIYIKVTKRYKDSTVNRILELVENASERKAKTENYINRFAKIYTPIVVCFAVLLAVIPSIITKNWQFWCGKSIAFLVSSCPCALVISVPLSFFSGIGCASRKGILVKGSNYLELLTRAKTFVFDKTGTLTKGQFEVVGVYPKENSEKVLKTASIVENFSNHPIAKSIVSCANGYSESGFNIEEISGKGIKAIKDDRVILCGNEKLMQEFLVKYEKVNDVGSVVYVAENGKFIGSIVVADVVKKEAIESIKELKQEGARVVMLTGDNGTVAKSVASSLGIEEYEYGLLPNEKVEAVEKLILEQGEKESLVFVGDGINDAPVLVRADIGISMGGIGSDSAIESADIVLMSDNLSGISIAKRIAKKTMKIIKQNVILCLIVKIAVMCLTAFGVIPTGVAMWLAVVADVGVAMITICNSILPMLLNVKRK